MARKGKASRDHAAKRCVIIDGNGSLHIHLGKVAIFKDEQLAKEYAEKNLHNIQRIAPAAEFFL